jgi:hypothetical protein
MKVGDKVSVVARPTGGYDQECKTETHFEMPWQLRIAAAAGFAGHR